jgi:hypothetical protein
MGILADHCGSLVQLLNSHGTWVVVTAQSRSAENAQVEDGRAMGIGAYFHYLEC